MKHRTLSLLIATLLITSHWACARDSRPNVILIMADDLGYETIGANGGTSYKTPVLDNMAKNGVRFEHCYSQPLCTPSRVKIMTGIYNVRNYVGFGKLDRKQRTFAHLFKEAGYTTCIAGKWQLGKEADAPQHFGFDKACLWQHETNGSRYPNPVLTVNGKVEQPKGAYGPDVCADFICDFMEANKKKPFLAYYSMILTHCPFEPTPDSKDWNPKSKGSKTYKGDARYFGDMVAYMDKLVGRITAKVESLGLRDNTLILFTGDNGTDKPVVSMMGKRKVAGAKGSMTDGGTRVPLIVNWPRVIKKGAVTQDLVDFSDFLPTICEAAGIDVPEELKIDGKSFLPQLKGQKGDPRNWAYCWYKDKRSGDVKVWARTQQYKLYGSGDFYDVSRDDLEKKPLTNPGANAGKVRAMLQDALDQYKDARPAGLGEEKSSARGKGKKKKKKKNKRK